ncbi:hypothetical protein [Fischerella thermalis]|nr:hypothetical protein [Fischerella thermalis]
MVEVLEEVIRDGDFTVSEVDEIASAVLRENAISLYGNKANTDAHR